MRRALKSGERPHTITGQLIQIRTKGRMNSSTYAYYATKHFVNTLLGLNK